VQKKSEERDPSTRVSAVVAWHIMSMNVKTFMTVN
jgi:hypothetical protein